LGRTRASFPLPPLAARLGQVTAELRDGRGFALIRGIPVDRLGEAEASTVLRGIGQYLGRPVPQTVDGHTVCHVREADSRGGAAPPPAHRTRAALPFHTDEADIAGLLCLQQARSGGRTLLASAAAVHNAVLESRPDLAGGLYDVRFFAQQAEQFPGERSYLAAPLITRHGTRPSMRYDRARLNAGQHLVQDSPAHGPDAADASGRTLYDVIEATAASPALRLDIDLRPGDLLLFDNHIVLHARTAFEDFAEPERKRHLLRLWLARHDDGPAPGGPADRRTTPHTRGGVTPHDVIRPRSLRPAHGGCGHPRGRHGST
ncbi:TauD/TfdA family dioxygenase, partial [Streptomyces sp. NPDC058964]|uniref:TauD/TfdA family dioxygenase n=1 Tax=Streptomyces sp. NPDC058964 TaxID=3346681 RepID=UPI0036B6313C